MPPVLGAIAPIAMNLAIGVGASVLSSIIRPQTQTRTETTARGLSFELTLGETVPVSGIWGRGRTGGHLTFAQEYGSSNQWLKLKIDCGYGHYDALETAIADEKPLTLTGSNGDEHGRVVEQYRDASGTPRMWMKAYTGAPGQTADAGLIAAVPTRWGASHTATARPYIIVTLNYQEDMFPSASLPRFGFVWRGLRLYDWRKDSTMPGGLGAHRWDNPATWEWTENPAVLAWNWRRGYWRNGVKLMGMGFSRYANDLAYFTACASLSDEQLYFQETNRWLARYAFGREIFDDEEHLQVLRQLEESWCGSSFDRGGAYAPVPASQQVSLLTLEDRHRIDGAAVQADKWGTVSSKKTRIHGTYAPIADLFAATPYGTRINVDLQTLTRGPKAQQFDQPYEHAIERAQYRAEIQLRRHIFGGTRTETFGPVANVLEPGDAIIRNCDWGPTLMIVDSVAPASEGLGKTVTMRIWSNTIVPSPTGGFVKLPPPEGVAPVPASRTLQVPGFDVQPYQRVTAGNEEPYARATWTPMSDPNCDQVIVKVWPEGEDPAATAQYFNGNARLQNALLFGPLKPNTFYRRIGILTRLDGRQTYPTNEDGFLTGDFKAAVEIGDGSVRPEHLATQLRNERGWLFGPEEGSLADQLLELERQLADMAAAGLTDRVDSKLAVRVLKASNQRSTAAIIETRKAIAEVSAAFALFQTEVAAQLNDLMAGGLLKIEAQVDEISSTAKIVFKVRAQATDTHGEAVLQLGATSNNQGGTSDSWIGMMADRLYFLATSGAVVTQPFAVQADFVKITTLRFEHILSLDGTTIIMDGTAPGFWSFGTP